MIGKVFVSLMANLNNSGGYTKFSSFHIFPKKVVFKNLRALMVALFVVLTLSGYTQAESYQFLNKWGTFGTGDGQFLQAWGVAVDPSNNVYVTEPDASHRVQKFNSIGAFITKWGSYGTGDGQFRSPYGVAVDSSGNIYVADTNNDRVQKFTSLGGFIIKWGSIRGSGDGQFNQPMGVAVDSSGNVYVADAVNNRIQKFNSRDGFIAKWGSIRGSGDGQFNYPDGIAVDSTGNVYVSDTWNHRIQKFTSNGDFITKWGSYGSGEGQFNWPRELAVDLSGNVYVADGWNHRIQKFTSNGDFITKWGSYGTGEGQFNWPTGVALDSSGNVYVVDRGNHRIQKFALVPEVVAPSNLFASDTPCDNGGGIAITWNLSPDDGSKVTGYRVYRSTTAGGAYELIGSVGAGVSSYTDTTATTGITHYYVVRAIDGTNESTNSNEASAASARNLPLPPINVTASDTPYDLGGSITLTWAKSVDDGAGLNNVLSYNVYRYSSTNGNRVLLASVPAGTTGYIDKTTVDTDIYYYSITALDSHCNIESAASDVFFGQSVNNIAALPGFIVNLPGIAPQLVNSLTSKTDNAVSALNRGNETATINMLEALLHEIKAQSGDGIDAATADILKTYIQGLISYLY